MAELLESREREPAWLALREGDTLKDRVPELEAEGAPAVADTVAQPVAAATEAETEADRDAVAPLLLL